jgi:predicted DNA-binding transcriptional regulator AlpA
MTATEVAAAIRVNRTTVTKLLNAGEFPNAFRLGDGKDTGRGELRIPQSDVESFVKRRKVGVPAAAVAASPDPTN